VKLLLLAPEPFYQDRGTPIAVSVVLRVLSERGDQVDVVAYHEGKDIYFENVTLHRIINLPFINHIRPGFSWKKVICDLFMLFKAIRLVSKRHYDLVVAVEESVFMALGLQWLFRVPYVYDMDSSLSQQMIERYRFLSPLAFLFKYAERIGVQNAKAVMTVCDALAESIQKHHPRKVAVIPDISLLGTRDSLPMPLSQDGDKHEPDRPELKR